MVTIKCSADGQTRQTIPAYVVCPCIHETHTSCQSLLSPPERIHDSPLGFLWLTLHISVPPHKPRSAKGGYDQMFCRRTNPANDPHTCPMPTRARKPTHFLRASLRRHTNHDRPRAVTRVNSTNVLDEGLRIGEIGRQMNSKVKLVETSVYRK
jgi:hypothetical protein